MVKIWLIGFIAYLLGVACVYVRVQSELSEDPEFLIKLLGDGDLRDESLGSSAPYFCAVFPVLNLVVGIVLMLVSINNDVWEMIKDKMLDKN